MLDKVAINHIGRNTQYKQCSGISLNSILLLRGDKIG